MNGRESKVTDVYLKALGGLTLLGRLQTGSVMQVSPSESFEPSHLAQVKIKALNDMLLQCLALFFFFLKPCQIIFHCH